MIQRQMQNNINKIRQFRERMESDQGKKSSRVMSP